MSGQEAVNLSHPPHAWNPLIPCPQWPQAGLPWLLGIAIQVSNRALVSLEVMSSIEIIYPLVNIQKAIEMAIEIVDLPIKNGDFP